MRMSLPVSNWVGLLPRVQDAHCIKGAMVEKIMQVQVLWTVGDGGKVIAQAKLVSTETCGVCFIASVTASNRDET